MSYVITEFMGDGIAGELSQVVRKVLETLPIDVELAPVDLSLENRRKERHTIYDKAFESIQKTKFAIKYPTITETESPNAVLRKLCDFSVIHRPVFSIPGVESNFKGSLDLDVIRVATGGTYEDPGRMIGTEAAVSIRIVERKPCEQAAKYAFQLAKVLNKPFTSSSKYTIQSVTDGLFQIIVDEVAEHFPEVEHNKELFDALLAKLVIQPDRYGVILVLNEYGDFLSDMACGLVGSMGIGGSGSYSFDEQGDVALAMFDPAGGTAPDIAGKNLVNPTAIFIALTLLFQQLGEVRLAKELKQATLNTLAAGQRTKDLGGSLNTGEFTDTVLAACMKNL
ncbi:isocitrate dehydrogenase [bacterium]|nr:isocitrate dehydrogenase [bacterium]